MPRSQIDPNMLARIQKALVEHPEEAIKGAHSAMRYKRKSRIEGGNLILQARRKRFETTADSVGAGIGMNIEPQMDPATPEELEQVSAALKSIDGTVLLKMMTGVIDYYGLIRKALEEILAEGHNESGNNDGGYQ
jgi:hypothetical protein